MEYKAQPIAAPNIQRSPIVNFNPIRKEISPLIIITRTPIKQVINPKNLIRLNFSPKKIAEIKIINIGDEV